MVALRVPAVAVSCRERLSPAWEGPEVSEQLWEEVWARVGWEGGRCE